MGFWNKNISEAVGNQTVLWYIFNLLKLWYLIPTIFSRIRDKISRDVLGSLQFDIMANNEMIPIGGRKFPWKLIFKEISLSQVGEGGDYYLLRICNLSSPLGQHYRDSFPPIRFVHLQLNSDAYPDNTSDRQVILRSDLWEVFLGPMIKYLPASDWWV